VVLGRPTTYNERRGIDFVKDFNSLEGEINYKIVWDDWNDGRRAGANWSRANR